MKPIVFTQSEHVRVMRRVEYQLSALHPTKKYRLEIKEHREKRGLDANAYAWRLIGEIASDQGIDPNDVYRSCIRKAGGAYEILESTKEAANHLIELWTQRGIGWMVDVLGDTPGGKVELCCWYGSSVFTAKEMYNLIQNLRQDCELLGLPYLTPEEEARLLEAWDARVDKGNADTKEG